MLFQAACDRAARIACVCDSRSMACLPPKQRVVELIMMGCQVVPSAHPVCVIFRGCSAFGSEANLCGPRGGATLWHMLALSVEVSRTVRVGVPTVIGFVV